jgi:hypothetical protein
VQVAGEVGLLLGALHEPPFLQSTAEHLSSFSHVIPENKGAQLHLPLKQLPPFLQSTLLQRSSISHSDPLNPGLHTHSLFRH